MSSSFIGKVVDNYRILESLGIGGMGVVFKAVNTKLDKLVALKMIAPGLAMNDNFIKRFQKEAKALARLADPNIVAIYDLRQENDQWYIVMEYVDGPNLIDKIKKEGALSPAVSISIIKDVLSAIGHAHEANIIHRDIKPNNIMLNSDGQAKITDFGLAKDTSISVNSMSIQSAGTLFYMSPEHVKGFSFTDKRSDIYSIGMTFYEMLSGNVPFQNMDSDFDIRETIVRKEFLKPTSFNKNVPKKLEAIIMKAIAKNPDDRYQTAYEMLEDLEKYENISSGSARPKKKSAPKPVIKRKGLFAAIVLLAMVVTFFVIQKEPLSAFIKKAKGQSIANEKEVISEPEAQTLQPQKTVESTPVLEQEKKEIITEKPSVKTDFSKTELFITSNPSQSKVFIDGEYWGETPYRFKGFKGLLARIHLEKKGYKNYETELSLKKNKKNSLYAELTAIVGSAMIQITPKDAHIKIDGKSVSVTSNPMHLRNLPVGLHSVEVTKKGFTSFSENFQITETELQRISVVLKELVGKLSVRINPWGSIYIDNKIHKANTDRKYEINLSENNYLLKVVHPSFGEWKKRIDILHDKEKSIVIDFTKKVVVRVDAQDENNMPISAQIIVDNKVTNFTTPENLQLTPGVHSFEIKKEGFIATEDRKELLIENNSQEAVKFVLKRVE